MLSMTKEIKKNSTPLGETSSVLLCMYVFYIHDNTHNGDVYGMKVGLNIGNSSPILVILV